MRKPTPRTPTLAQALARLEMQVEDLVLEVYEAKQLALEALDLAKLGPPKNRARLAALVKRQPMRLDPAGKRQLAEKLRQRHA